MKFSIILVFSLITVSVSRPNDVQNSIIVKPSPAPGSKTTYDWGQHTGSGSTYDWGQHTGSGSTYDWGQHTGSGSTYDWGQHTGSGSTYDWGQHTGSGSTYDWGQHTGSGSGSRTTYPWGQYTSTPSSGDGDHNGDGDHGEGDSNYRCGAGTYSCKGAMGMCIRLTFICDGHMNCPHGDDEDKSMCWPGFGNKPSAGGSSNIFAGTGFMFRVKTLNINGDSKAKLFNQNSDNVRV